MQGPEKLHTFATSNRNRAFNSRLVSLTMMTMRLRNESINIKKYTTMTEKMQIAMLLAVFREGETLILLDDLNEDAQKRIIVYEMASYIDCCNNEVKVENVTVEEDLYGYDPDDDEPEVIECVHADINGETWLMWWDCFTHEFTCYMEENQN